MIKEIEYVFKTVNGISRFGSDEILNTGCYPQSVQTSYFIVERELTMRFFQSKQSLEQNGYQVNITHIPIPDSDNLHYTKIDVTDKSHPYAVIEFYDNAPIRV